MLSFFLKSGDGNPFSAHITDFGALAVAPLKFSTPQFVELTAANVPGNFVSPTPGSSIVITDITIHANRNVGVNDATVEIYEASGIDVTAAIKTIFKQEVPKNSTLPLNGLHWMARPGAFLNVKSNDTIVFVNLACYFVPVELE